MIYVKSLKAFDLRKLIHVKTRAFFFSFIICFTLFLLHALHLRLTQYLYITQYICRCNKGSCHFLRICYELSQGVS